MKNFYLAQQFIQITIASLPETVGKDNVEIRAFFVESCEILDQLQRYDHLGVYYLPCYR